MMRKNSSANTSDFLVKDHNLTHAVKQIPEQLEEKWGVGREVSNTTSRRIWTRRNLAAFATLLVVGALLITVTPLRRLRRNEVRPEDFLVGGASDSCDGEHE